MRKSEFNGIYHMIDALDPAVIREQRLAELRDLAEFRYRKLAAIKAWSDPEAIAQRKAERELESQKALERGKAMAEKAKDDLKFKALSEMIKITPIVKPKQKKTWLDMFVRLLGRG